MSWQAAILALLGLVLVAGFAWYERSRPPARIVALVAALAALAAATRLVLAPVPNVVGTTDVALITGYALGPAPGFAVGSLAAVVSNLWLGQGPWTPWQMAGWGMAGLLGAWLAALTGRRAGRIGLAAACGVAGLLYGALLDLSVMVSYGGEQSLDRYLALSARGIPFNLAHAAGNVALALAAGPALVSMLSRYRRRLEFRWRRAGAPAAACALAALVIAPALVPSAPGVARAGEATDAAAWLRSAQGADGGFATEPGGESSSGMTGWAALGMEAAGRHPADVRRGGRSALRYLRETIGEVRTTGDIERTVLVVEAAGLSSRRFAGVDLVAKLRRRRGANGSWSGQVNLTAFGVLALAAADSRAGSNRSGRWLRGAQNEDGGWGFATGAGSDPDSTGAAMQALAAAGGSRRSLRRAVGYLRRSQRRGGGFALLSGPVNSQSTAWAVQGLIAAGVDPAGMRRQDRSPLDYLAARQAGDGHYRYSAHGDQTPVWVTAQVLAAVSGEAFPLEPVARRPRAPDRVGSAGGEGERGATAPGRGGTGAHRRAGTAPAPAEGSIPPAAAETPSLEAASAEASSDEGEGGGAAAWLAGGGTLAAVGLIWGGWLLYRRRLPG